MTTISDPDIVAAFTATHPAGVATVTAAIGNTAQRSRADCLIRAALTAALAAQSGTPLASRHRSLGWSYAAYYSACRRADGRDCAALIAEYQAHAQGGQRRTYTRRITNHPQDITP